jgi:Ca-activated chloride channel homolog
MKKIIKTSVCLIILLALFSCGKKNDEAAGVKSPGEKDSWTSGADEVKVDQSQISKKNYYIILDGSGSMSGNKLAVAKVALKKFISLIPRDSNIALTVFDRNGNSERASFGSTRMEISSAIDGVEAGGQTPLGKSIEIAGENLGKQSKRQLGYGEYNLVIITDGQASDVKRMDRAVKKILNESPIVIHTIGFQIGKGHSLNQPGKIYYKTAKNFDELSKGLEEVLAEIEDFTVKKF